MNHKRAYSFIFILLLIWAPLSEVRSEQKEEKSAEQKLLERYAKDSLRRLRHAAKSEGFFNARAALNIWKSNAMDAGVFDEDLYQEIKRKIYEKSVNDNLKWYDIFLLQKNYRDARICLELYRMHAQEIGIFDEERYEELKERQQK